METLEEILLLRRNGLLKTESHQLTPREIEVLTLVLEGASQDDIAGVLGITAKTVGEHTNKIKRRMELSGNERLLHALWRRKNVTSIN